MKKNSNILKYPVMLVVFIAILIGVDKLFGYSMKKSFWAYCIQGLFFVSALLLFDVAEKHGWDTWSGLISKFKKNNR